MYIFPYTRDLMRDVLHDMAFRGQSGSHNGYWCGCRHRQQRSEIRADRRQGDVPGPVGLQTDEAVHLAKSMGQPRTKVRYIYILISHNGDCKPPCATRAVPRAPPGWLRSRREAVLDSVSVAGY